MVLIKSWKATVDIKDYWYMLLFLQHSVLLCVCLRVFTSKKVLVKDSGSPDPAPTISFVKRKSLEFQLIKNPQKYVCVCVLA